ncbi:MAG: DMT family transporter [Salinivirgaceae bacterium]|nr:DMT family transporter [Salinivirgaceae bacterium]MDD4746853.1 DMT family transporter [Salinivirgaceae bacterium]
MKIPNTDKNAKYLALGAVFFWATVATAFKIGLEKLEPAIFLFYVILSSLLFFVGYLTYTKQWNTFKKITVRNFSIAIFAGLLNPFAYYLILFEAYDRLPAQVAQSLNYTWPIVLVLMSSFINKQKIQKNVIWGLTIGFTGVLFVASRGHFFSLSFDGVGIFLAIFSSIIWASYWIISKTSQIKPVQFLFINQFVGLLATVSWILIADCPFIFPNTQSLLATLYSGWFEMGITFVLWISAIRMASRPDIISHFIYFAPFLSLFFIRFILNEPIYFSTFIGLIMITIGVLFVEFGTGIIKTIRKKLSI